MQSLSLPQKAGESSTSCQCRFFMEETVIYLQQTAYILPADFPLVLKKDKLNTFALALSRKTRQRQSRGEVRGGGTLV